MKQVIAIFFAVSLGSCAACCEQATQTRQEALLKAYQQYYTRTEALLDTICAHDPNYVLDVLAEQDVYQDYLDADKEIEKLSK